MIEESKKNVKNYVWAPCILSLSSVIKRSIITCYPDFGIAKYRVVFNQKVWPRCKDNCFVPFRILFCGLSNVEKNTNFCPSHYVPLVNRKQNKRGRKRIVNDSENSLYLPLTVSSITSDNSISNSSVFFFWGGEVFHLEVKMVIALS